MSEYKSKSILSIYIILLGFLFVILALIMMFYISYNDLERDVDLNAKNFLQAIENYEKISTKSEPSDNPNKNSSYKTFIEQGEVPLISDNSKDNKPEADDATSTVQTAKESTLSVNDTKDDGKSKFSKENINNPNQTSNNDKTKLQKLSVTSRLGDEKGQQRLWTIQIASFNSETKARQSWRDYQAKDKNLFGQFDASFDQVTFNNKAYTRVRIGTFTSYDQADSYCIKLKQNKYSCLVTKLE